MMNEQWISMFFLLLCVSTKVVLTTPTVPSLKGIFLSLYSIDEKYTSVQWEMEFEAMSKVGIEFVGVRAALQGTSSETAGGCPLGRYKAMYPTTLKPAICYQNDMSLKNSLLYILSAAKKFDIKVHVTPAMPHTPFAWPHSPYPQDYDSLTTLQTDVFMDAWNQFPAYHDTIVGVYTALEEWNGVNWMEENNSIPLARNYYEPLSQNVRNQTGVHALQVWASPYFVGNKTLHPTGLNASSYANFWLNIWKRAPSFDWIALQDSMGWQGNNFEEVKEVLIELEKAGHSVNRQVWSNVELFEGDPLPCVYPKKCGRQPASIHRIIKQLKNEHPYVKGHIAWEWISCLSPFTNNDTLRLFNEYVDYIESK